MKFEYHADLDDFVRYLFLHTDEANLRSEPKRRMDVRGYLAVDVGNVLKGTYVDAILMQNNHDNSYALMVVDSWEKFDPNKMLYEYVNAGANVIEFFARTTIELIDKKVK
jgi:hypothetical protein